MMPDLLFLAALFFTVFCLAVNAYTWRIAYPLWRSAGPGFDAIHADYMRRLTPVITAPHIGMFVTSAALLVWRPLWPGDLWVWIVFLLETAVIGVSIAIAGPVHDRFIRQGTLDEPGMERLIQVSFWRTVLMLLACLILLWRLTGVFSEVHQLERVMM